MSRDMVACGRFLRTFGVEGELRFEPYLPEDLHPEDISRATITGGVGGKGREVDIASIRIHGGGWLVRIDGVNSPEDARRFTHCELWVERSVLRPLGEGEFLHQDIIGCRVVDESGADLGVIKDIFPTGANDVWEVKKADGKELLIPSIKEVILSVDTNGRKVTVRLPEGLDEP